MAKVIKAPGDYEQAMAKYSFIVFLAGSIEMGAAEDWQEEITHKLSHLEDLVILNPRRDDWDSSWEQSIENEKFYEQVEWELNAMDDANMIFMHFDPKTKSPITLLELGLHANMEENLIVHCPEGFWRKGNVDIVCQRHNCSVVDSIDEAVEEIEDAYTEYMAYD